MKNKIIFGIVILVLVALAYVFMKGDTENRFTRLGVSYFDGNYVITHHGMSGLDAWLVIDGKVTSEPSKGYYHTRVRVQSGKTAYIQLPITNTVIEEFTNVSQLTQSQTKILVGKYGNNLHSLINKK
jgi:hypothetical protein